MESNFVLVVGTLFTVSTMRMLIKAVDIDRSGYKTIGKIVDVAGEWGRMSETIFYYYNPVVQFTNQKGNLLERKMEVFTTLPWMWKKNKNISIIYYEDNIYPTASGWVFFYIMLVLIGVGIVAYNLIVRFF